MAWCFSLFYLIFTCLLIKLFLLCTSISHSLTFLNKNIHTEILWYPSPPCKSGSVCGPPFRQLGLKEAWILMDISSACPVAFLKVTVQGQKLVSLGIAAIHVCALFSSQLSCLKYRKCSKHIFNLLCWKYSILHFLWTYWWCSYW